MGSKYLLLTTVLLSGCILGGDPPGEGEKARAGLQQAASILVAIEAFQSAEGRYPDSLGELVPAVLDSTRVVLTAPRSGNYPFMHEIVDDGYTLTFEYAGPGMNQCTFTRSTLSWSCSGYF